MSTVVYDYSEVLAIVIEVTCEKVEGLDPADVNESSHYRTDLAANSGEIQAAREALEVLLDVVASDEEVKTHLTVGAIAALYSGKLAEVGRLAEPAVA